MKTQSGAGHWYRPFTLVSGKGYVTAELEEEGLSWGGFGVADGVELIIEFWVSGEKVGD